MISRLAGKAQLAELDERVDAITRDVRYLKSLVMAPAAARLAPDLSQRDQLRMHELRVFSQNGEDGVLAEIFGRIGVAGGGFVEFGASDGAENRSVAAPISRCSGSA